MGQQNRDCLFLIIYKDQKATYSIFFACSKLSGRLSKTTMSFDLYFYYVIKVPQKGCEQDYKKAIDTIKFYSDTLIPRKIMI